jgi:hypothetical protein
MRCSTSISRARLSALTQSQSEMTNWKQLEEAANQILDNIPAYREREPRTVVRWFAQQMEIKLKENDFKDGIDKVDVEYCLERLQEELEELKMSLAKQRNKATARRRIIRECADVANFAMMLANYVRDDQ